MMMKKFTGTCLRLAVVFALFSACSSAAEMVSVQQLRDEVVLLHVDDGRVEYHQLGGPRSAGRRLSIRLTMAAIKPGSYGIESTDDRAYVKKTVPVSIARKSKGRSGRGLLGQRDSLDGGRRQPESQALRWPCIPHCRFVHRQIRVSRQARVQDEEGEPGDDSH